MRSGSGFDFSSAPKTILRNIRLSVREGANMALLGASGSGKTTLGRCIAGLLRPDSGTIRLRGQMLSPLSAGKTSRPSDVQMVFQGNGVVLNPMLPIRKTLQEALSASMKGLAGAAVKSEVTKALALVGLSEETMNAFPRQLSGGQRQLVAIARALVTHPRLLILDEPTSALDPISKSHVLTVLNTVHALNGVTMLLITHDSSVASALCTDCAIIDRGGILEQGTLATMKEHPQHQRTRALLNVRVRPMGPIAGSH